MFRGLLNGTMLVMHFQTLHDRRGKSWSSPHIIRNNIEHHVEYLKEVSDNIHLRLTT